MHKNKSVYHHKAFFVLSKRTIGKKTQVYSILDLWAFVVKEDSSLINMRSLMLNIEQKKIIHWSRLNIFNNLYFMKENYALFLLQFSVGLPEIGFSCIYLCYW